MIKVLQFANVINRNDFIDIITQNADRRNFQIDVCIRNRTVNIAEPIYSQNTNVFFIPGESRKNIPYTALRLAKILRENQIDIIHTHHYDQALIAWLAIKIYPKTKLIVGRHYSDALYLLPSKIKSGIYIATEQLIYRDAKKIIVPSRYIHNSLVEKQNIPSEKIDVVWYGFDPEKYSKVDFNEIKKIREEFQTNGKFVIGLVGRLGIEKGHRYLIEAVDKLKETIPNLLVLFIGEGPQRKSLEKQIRELKLEEFIKFTGWRKNAIDFINAVDAIVQPTLQEAFSQVMVEAMWMSKPLIMTEVSGATDIIKNYDNGLLIEKNNSIEIAKAIENVVQDKSLRDKIAANGHKFVTENLTAEKIVPQYENVYYEVFNNK
jgi:glycosyltransferase involved in cell wall biosynthesis